MERSKTHKDLLILFCLASIVLLWNLGTGSLSSWDEGFYGSVSRQILNTGDWLSLKWRGAVWHDKPPLYMWVSALFYMFFGASELTTRLFSCLCGIGTVLVTYLFACRLYSRKAGLCSALILLSSWHFLWSSKNGMLDIPLTFFVTLSLFLFKLGDEKKICLFFSLMAMAAAFLTKGMAAIVIPGTLFTYLIFSKNLKLLKEPAFIAGLITASIAVGWWHWLSFSHYGGNFIHEYFVQNILTRSTKAMDGHTGDILTYFGVIPNKGRPWAGIGLALIPYALLRLLKNKENEHLLPIIWASTIFVLFSVVKTKLHWYIMPVYPALSILAGEAICKILKKHTIPVISILFVCSLTYLTIDKNIFGLDYSPQIKQTVIAVKNVLPEGEKLFMYEITDPGMQFYLGDIGENVHEKEDLRRILKEKGNFVITSKNALTSFSDLQFSTVLETPNFIVILARPRDTVPEEVLKPGGFREESL